MLSALCFSEFEVMKCSINRKFTHSSRRPSPILRRDVYTCVLSGFSVHLLLELENYQVRLKYSGEFWIYAMKYVFMQHRDSVRLLQIWGSRNKVTGRITGSTGIGHFSHGLPRVAKWISFKSTFSHNFLGIYILTLVSKSPFMTPKQFFIMGMVCV